MDKRFRAVSLWGALTLAVLGAACQERSRPNPRGERPHLVLFLLDGVGTELGTYGSPALSPHLDALAGRGRRFDRAYASYPALAPSRLSLLTGRRPERTRLYEEPEDPGRVSSSLVTDLEAAGYATVRIGRVVGPHVDAALPWTHTVEADGAEAVAGAAASFLAERHDRPFLLVLGFPMPLADAMPPADLLARYDTRRLPPEPEAADPSRFPRLAFAEGAAGVPPAPAPTPVEWRRRERAVRLAHISALDAQVGRVLEVLERGALASRAVVTAAADTAPPGPWPKRDVLIEEALRAGLVVAGPGVERGGQASAALVEMVDVAATLRDLAGLPPARDGDGVSLGPVLTDPTQAPRRAAVSAVRRFAGTLGRTVRTERFRYTEWPDGSRELFDHTRDPREQRNLAGDPEHAGEREGLARVLREGPAGARAPSRPPAPVRSERPDVLFVVIDDLNTQVGSWGHPVSTPNLDRLAREGRRFESAYVQIASCNPSRTSFLTGWRPERTQVLDNLDDPHGRIAGAVPLQEHFRAHGYFTARIGKVYHGPFEGNFRWDLAEGTPWDPADEANEPAPRRERMAAGGPSLAWTATDNDDADEPDGRAARRAARVIAERRGRPFVVAVGFNKPHVHWIAPRPYFERHPAESVSLPAEDDDDWKDIPEIALFRRAPLAPGRFLRGRPEPRDDALRRQAIAAYRACVSFVDAQLGVLLDTLDRLGIRDRTIVVVVSDNGHHLGEHGGLWRKNTLFEEALHVPLLISGPAVRRPGVPATALVEAVDIYPTLVDLAGLPEVPGLDGQSLRPLLEEPTMPFKTAVFAVAPRQPPELGRSVRTDRWRYTEWPDGGRELYDLERGGWRASLSRLLGRPTSFPPNEAEDPARARVIEELRSVLDPR
jgi:uncharacterized sulfatase